MSPGPRGTRSGPARRRSHGRRRSGRTARISGSRESFKALPGGLMHVAVERVEDVGRFSVIVSTPPSRVVSTSPLVQSGASAPHIARRSPLALCRGLSSPGGWAYCDRSARPSTQPFAPGVPWPDGRSPTRRAEQQRLRTAARAPPRSPPTTRRSTPTRASSRPSPSALRRPWPTLASRGASAADAARRGGQRRLITPAASRSPRPMSSSARRNGDRMFVDGASSPSTSSRPTRSPTSPSSASTATRARRAGRRREPPCRAARGRDRQPPTASPAP